ncbi:hypothetical protein [Ligilactobacillus equi]
MVKTKSKYALEYSSIAYDNMADEKVLYYPYNNELHKVRWRELVTKLGYKQEDIDLLKWNFGYDTKLDRIAYRHGVMKLSDKKDFWYDFNGVVHVDLYGRKKQPYIAYHSRFERRQRGYVALCGKRVQEYVKELVKRDKALNSLYGDVIKSGHAQVHHSLPWFSQELKGNRIGWFKVLPADKHNELTTLLQRLENDIRDYLDKAPYMELWLGK